jgi:hypothetical protein
MTTPSTTSNHPSATVPAMEYEVTVAVFGDWLPGWEPPVGDQGFEVPYADRMKVELVVSEDESLESVLRRAVDAVQPRAVSGSQGFTDDPMSTVYWTWFYEPADEQDLKHKHYEMAPSLILVDRDGRVRWHVPREQIPYGDLVRSADHGLLRGDPLRPYLVLLIPQGSGDWQLAWDAVRLVWEVLGGLLATRETFKLSARSIRSLQNRLRGAEVAAIYEQDWTSRGGGPHDIARVIERGPWEASDLAALMGVAADEDAKAILELFGCTPDADGRYALGEDLESRILRLAEDEAFVHFRGVTPTEDELRKRLLARLEAASPENERFA